MHTPQEAEITVEEFEPKALELTETTDEGNLVFKIDDSRELAIASNFEVNTIGTDKSPAFTLEEKPVSTVQLDENLFESTYEVICNFELVKEEYDAIFDEQISDATFSLLNYEDTTKQDYPITGYLKITYSLSSTPQYPTIKITNVSGNWTWPSALDMDINEREVLAYDGLPFQRGDELVKYPSSNTFNYDTGWGYVQKYPFDYQSFSGPRAETYFIYRISSMGSTWHEFHMQLGIV